MKLSYRFVVAALMLLLMLSPGASALQVATTAPKLAGFSIQGTTVNLESFKGKQNVLVLFYRTQG